VVQPVGAATQHLIAESDLMGPMSVNTVGDTGGSLAAAVSGHAAAGPPRSVMKSRRFITRCLPCFREKDSTPQLQQATAALQDFNPPDVGFGSRAAQGDLP
jgi:hypothetical protein